METRPTGSRSKFEFGRHARRTLYVVAGFYVIVGFVAAAASAVSGDRLGTFIGFLIISGAIGGAVLLRSVLHVEACVSAMSEAMLDARERLAHVERTLGALGNPSLPHEPPPADLAAKKVLDLASIGSGDPSLLTAATLDRAVFPRLVASMEEEPPAQSPTTTDDTVPAGEATSDDNGMAPASINLLRQWKIALRNGDLSGCRAVYGAMVDTVGAEEAQPLRLQIEQLADRVEQSLREAFAVRFRAGDFAEALALGERLCHLLPDRPVAAEFRRIEPHLLRRLEPVVDEPVTSAAP